MTRDELKAKGFNLQPDGSWSKRPPVGAVVASIGEQAPIRPLERGIQKRQKGKGGVAVVVSLIACRSRELDDDGNVASLKPLRDAIAATLELDDADRRIRFEYGQIETRSGKGVIVKVQNMMNVI